MAMTPGRRLSAENATRAVFIDPDGTLMPDVAHSVDPERVSLHPLAARGLQLLQQRGYVLFIVSSQPGVAHGVFGLSDLKPVMQRIDHLLARERVTLAGYYFCPHHPDGKVPAFAIDCTCRKPEPGLIQRAAADHGIDLGRSWMVGDILNDIESGRRAGCKTVLLCNGSETEWRTAPHRLPHLVTFNLYRAAEAILLNDHVV